MYTPGGPDSGFYSASHPSFLIWQGALVADMPLLLVHEQRVENGGLTFEEVTYILMYR